MLLLGADYFSVLILGPFEYTLKDEIKLLDAFRCAVPLYRLRATAIENLVTRGHLHTEVLGLRWLVWTSNGVRVILLDGSTLEHVDIIASQHFQQPMLQLDHLLSSLFCRTSSRSDLRCHAKNASTASSC